MCSMKLSKGEWISPVEAVDAPPKSQEEGKEQEEEVGGGGGNS